MIPVNDYETYMKIAMDEGIPALKECVAQIKKDKKALEEYYLSEKKRLNLILIAIAQILGLKENLDDHSKL